MKSFLPSMLLLGSVMLTSCDGFRTTPELQPTAVVATATATLQAATATHTTIPTVAPTASSTPLPPASSSTPNPDGLVYYYFVNPGDNIPQDGSIGITPDTYILARTHSEIVPSGDPAHDLQTVLQVVLNDERNLWMSQKLEISKVSFRQGRAEVILQGEYYGVAPVTLEAARMQILMTLFANPALQSAVVTLNGDTIANVAISISRDAKPADYVFTRAEIESFMKEHAYVTP